MYEMCPALDDHGIAVVWHLKAKQSAQALCGQLLTGRLEQTEHSDADTAQAETAPHCQPCMTSFAQLVDQRG